MLLKSNLVLAILFSLVILLALFLRIYKIDSIPPGLTWDEAALGYNAYSILNTLKDEYGNFLPITLKSFGDYKPALYAYADIPFIALLGLNEFAVRLPSVLAGTGFVVLVYLLVLELFKRKWLALSSAFMASISPLSIQFSRSAFESNLALFLNVLGIYLFVRALKNKKFYILSALCFILSVLTYQSSKIFVPMLLFGAFIVFKSSIKREVWFNISLGFFSLAFLAILFSVVFFGQTNRLETANFFAYQRSDKLLTEITNEDGLSKDSFVFEFLHGEWFAYTRGLFERYLIYFSPRMLFIDGDYSGRHRVPDLGMLYYFSAILIPFGIYFIFKNNSSGGRLIFYWLAVAAIPAVLSRDLINIVRALNLTLPFVVLEGAGLYFLISLLNKRKILFYLGLGVIIFVIFANVTIYLDRLFIHAPKEYSQFWLYGYKQVLSMARSQDRRSWDKYNKVVMTDKYGQPYIYYLFYTKYNPAKFQAQANLYQKSVDVGSVKRIDNIEFRSIYWPEERGDRNSLFIGTIEELPDQDTFPFKEFNVVGDVSFLDGLKGFRVVEIKQ